MKKICKKCQIIKSLPKFSNKKGGKFGKNSICKKCDRIYQKEIRDKDPNRQKRITERSSIRRKNARAFVNEIKMNGKCYDCEKKYPTFCMEFDHKYNKLMDISLMVNKGFSIERLKIELEKCDLVCVLCHRNRTFERFKLNNQHNKDKVKNLLYIICNEMKNKPCATCKTQYNYWQMDWDHINQHEKIETVSQLIQKRVNKNILLNEINKCQLLCAICHRIKTNS